MSLSREEIIRMAREAGVIPRLVETTGTYFAHVETLANAAYAAGAVAEREACAMVCDETLAQHYMKQTIPARDESLLLAACADCAAAIRARGDK